MSRPDEGLIHAWLDGELDAVEAARVEALVRDDREWAAAAAEARGFMAASSRILGALDDVPANVIPAKAGAAQGSASGSIARRGIPWWTMRAAAVLVVVVGTVVVVRRVPQEPDAAFATAQSASKDVGSATPAPAAATAPAAPPTPGPPPIGGASKLAAARNAPVAPKAQASEADAGQRMEKVAGQATTVAPPMSTAPGTSAAPPAAAPISRALADEQRAADIGGRAPVASVAPPPAAKAANEVAAFSAAKARNDVAAPAVACYREPPTAPGTTPTVHRVVPTSDSTAVPELPADGKRATGRFRADAPSPQLVVRHDTLFLSSANTRTRVALRITCPQP